MQEDRRRQRSEDPAVAMKLQLEQVVKDFKLRACVVADEAGRLVSSSGEEVLLAQLAHCGVAIAANAATASTWQQLEKSRVGRDQVTAMGFRAGGKRYVLTAAGQERTWRDVGVFRAILGLRRIRGAS